MKNNPVRSVVFAVKLKLAVDTAIIAADEPSVVYGHGDVFGVSVIPTTTFKFIPVESTLNEKVYEVESDSGIAEND
jgi:hypothetical protein